MSIKKPSGPILREAIGGIKQRAETFARSHEPILCIEFQMRDGRVFGFPYSHLMHYQLEESADPESDAFPEKLTFEFSRHDVVITGRRLSDLRQVLQAGSLASLCEMDSRYQNVDSDESFVSTIEVKPVAEVGG